MAMNGMTFELDKPHALLMATMPARIVHDLGISSNTTTDFVKRHSNHA
ncbi:hypothetical protein SAMN04488042_11449 [Shimia aestuarii]|uniref:Uncharacterized protein n=1 Tax=Shimia aestuarii TaxID=254406 RepID=A0A1I4T9S1_9RHOB|nr:hypothetical protein SAMN04488042_11449 [Shimia aestuarii]